MLNISSLSANKVTMDSKKIISEALEFWLKKHKITQQKLAEKIGLSQNYISQIKTGEKESPSFKTVEKISDGFGVSLLEFLTCNDENKPDIDFVERVKARPRAGVGGLETDADHDGHYAFHSQFLTRKGASAKDMKIFEVAGDSMEPILSEGDLIMINLRDKAIRTGRIYLLRIGDELMVKRLETRPGNTLLIRSDNSHYEDIPVNTSEVDGEIEIFGRMVWSCREY